MKELSKTGMMPSSCRTFMFATKQHGFGRRIVQRPERPKGPSMEEYGANDKTSKVKTLELLKSFKDQEFNSMEEFFDFINKLEDEG